MKTRMTSREMLTSRLKSQNETVIKSGFVGTEQIVNPNDEWVKELMEDVKDYVLEELSGQGVLTEIITTEGAGLKVTDKNKIDIDDEVEFIIDAND
jgi:hypothetical protein